MIFRGKGGGIQSLHKVKKKEGGIENWLLIICQGGVIMRLLEGLIRGEGQVYFIVAQLKSSNPSQVINNDWSLKPVTK